MECRVNLRFSFNCLVCAVGSKRCSLSSLFLDETVGPTHEISTILAAQYHALLFKLKAEGATEYPESAARIKRSDEGDFRRRHGHIFSKMGKMSQEERETIRIAWKKKASQHPAKPRPKPSAQSEGTGTGLSIVKGSNSNATFQDTSGNSPSQDKAPPQLTGKSGFSDRPSTILRYLKVVI